MKQSSAAFVIAMLFVSSALQAAGKEPPEPGALATARVFGIAIDGSAGTNKRYGRVGDSPLIGAGTCADNASCAVSAAGHGEYFIRLAMVAGKAIELSEEAAWR